MVEFIPVQPFEVDILEPEAVEYLDRASGEIHGYFSSKHALDAAKAGAGMLFKAQENGILGCFYISFRQYPVGRVMSVILLGGRDFESWGVQLHEFLTALALKNGAVEFTMMGRKGWAKIFPDFEHLACIYRKRLISAV